MHLCDMGNVKLCNRQKETQGYRNTLYILNGFLESRLYSYNTFDILGRVILYCGGCPGHYKMFSSTPGLYLLPVTAPIPKL